MTDKSRKARRKFRRRAPYSPARGGVAAAMTTLVLGWLLVATPAPADTWPMNQRNLRIPIRVDPARRAEIRELHLFVSSDLGRTWNQYGVASPDQDAFPFFAQTDGVYWFSVEVVDQRGNRDPPDIYRVPPAQKILVDTLRPVIRIAAAERQGDDVAVAWEIQEDYPDLSTFRVEWRGADNPAAAWTPVPVAVAPALVGQARFRAPVSGPIAVRVALADTAGNPGEATRDVVAGTGPAPAYSAAAYPAPGPQTYPQAAPQNYAPTAAPAWEPPRHDVNPYASTNYQTMNPALGDASRPVASSQGPVGTSAGAPAYPPRSGYLPPVQLVNNTHVNLAYEVRGLGASGFGKACLYVTRDEGQTWQLLTEDTNQTSQLAADLPGEGVYGFRIVVFSRAGLGKRPPAGGELPEMRIEVDTKAPEAKLFAAEVDPAQREALLLKWEATDKNLAANPVTLEWADQPGHWQPIARELPNTGRYSWRPPPGIPPQVYLRLTVRDQAGNVAVAETDRPQLIDLSEPEGRLLGLKQP